MSIDNIEFGIGDIITVLEWNEVTRTSGYGFGENIYKTRDRSYVGDELKVIAIDLPFVKVVRKGSDYDIVLNLNELSVKKLSDEFVNAEANKDKK